MLIGITGAGSTGKTTLAKALADWFEIPFIPSVSRQVFEQFNLTEEDQRRMTPSENLTLQQHIFAAKTKQFDDLLRKPDPQGVADRTQLDHLIYCMYRCAGAYNLPLYEQDLDKVEREFEALDVILYCPFVRIKDTLGGRDGFREDNEIYRMTIDLMIYGMLRHPLIGALHKMRWVFWGSHEYRVIQAVNAIKSIMKENPNGKHTS